MLFINPNNEYPRHLGDLLGENPDWEENDPLPNGWQAVAYADEIPEPGKNQVRVEVFPTEKNGILTQTFIIRDLTAEELAEREAALSLKEKLESLNLSPIEKRTIALGRITF